MVVCSVCSKEFKGDVVPPRHVVACSKGTPRTTKVWTLFGSGVTEVRDHITEEIEIIKTLFDDVVVETPDGFLPQLTFDISSSDDDRRALTRCHIKMRISVVYGYPFVAPRIEIFSTLDDEDEDIAIDAKTAKLLLQKLQSTTEQALQYGSGFIATLIFAAQEFLNTAAHAGAGATPAINSSPAGAVTAPSAAATQGNRQASAQSSKKCGSALAASSSMSPAVLHVSTSRTKQQQQQQQQQVGQQSRNGSASVSPPPVDLLAPPSASSDRGAFERERKRLSVFALHLLSRLCSSGGGAGLSSGAEKGADALTTFEALKDYLCSDLQLLHPDVTAHFCAGSVRSYFKSIISNALEQGPPLSWLWRVSDSDAASALTRAVAEPARHSRFKREFVQLRKLGEGGFAPVFLCRKVVDGRLYAVKKQLVKREDAAKALREVQLLASLSHVNIVRYYDAWLEETTKPQDANGDSDDDDEEEDEEGTGSAAGELAASRGSVSGGRRRSAAHFFDGVDEDEDEDEADEEMEEEEEEESAPRQSSSDVLTGVLSGADYHILFIQMELCHPLSLQDAIERPEVAKDERILSTVLRQLLHVVAYCHSKRTIHRDLKPENILFDAVSHNFTGNIKVVDFGLARELAGQGMRHARSFHGTLDDLAAADEQEGDEDGGGIGNEDGSGGTIKPKRALVTGGCGTVLYCAPEQLESDDYGMSVDEYSIGMIAFDMWLGAAGKVFRERFMEMEALRRTGRLPEWFMQWRPQVAKIIMHLTALNPTERWQASEILGMAELPGEPIEIGVALDTCTKNMDRMIERILHRNRQHFLSQPLKLSRCAASVSESFRAVHRLFAITAACYNAQPAFAIQPFVPLTQELDWQHCDVLTDERGRCWCRPRSALVPIAYHIVASRRSGGSTVALPHMHGTYHHHPPGGEAAKPPTSSYFACGGGGAAADADCTNFALQLIAGLHAPDSTFAVEFTHGGLFHLLPPEVREAVQRTRAIDPNRALATTCSGSGGSGDVGTSLTRHSSRGPTPSQSPTSRGIVAELALLRRKVVTTDDLERVLEATAVTLGLPSREDDNGQARTPAAAHYAEVCELLMAWWGAVLHSVKDQRHDAVPSFTFDPLLRPASSEEHAAVHGGVLAVFSIGRSGVLHPFATVARAEGFLSAFELSGAAVTIAAVEIDTRTLSEHTSGVAARAEEPVLQCGVGVLFNQRRGSEEQLVATLALLRQRGIRADRVSAHESWEKHCKAARVHQLWWTLQPVGDRLLLSRTVVRPERRTEIPLGGIGASVREILSRAVHDAAVDRAAAASKDVRVHFLSREDSSCVQFAKDSLADVTHPLPGTIVAVQLTQLEIRQCVTDFVASCGGGSLLGGGGGGGTSGGGGGGGGPATPSAPGAAAIAAEFGGHAAAAAIDGSVGAAPAAAAAGAGGGGANGANSGVRQLRPAAKHLHDYLRHYSANKLIPIFSMLDGTLELYANTSILRWRKEMRRGGGGGGGGRKDRAGGSSAKIAAAHLAASGQ